MAVCDVLAWTVPGQGPELEKPKESLLGLLSHSLSDNVTHIKL